MFRNVLRLVTETAGVARRLSPAAVPRTAAPVPVSVRRLTDAADGAPPPFDPVLLDFLVCPLSKKPLRYDAATNELINEELGIAYPILDGIPNMIPQDARLIHKDAADAPQQQQ